MKVPAGVISCLHRWWSVPACGLLLSLGCSERETAVLGFELVEEAVEGTGPFRLEIESSDLDTFFQTTRQGASRLWVGNQPARVGDVEAKTLLRFRVELPDGAEVLTDTLRLACDADGDYGNPVAQTVAFERILDAAWYEDTTTGYPFDAHEPLSPETTSMIEACTVDSVFGTDRVTVVLPPSLIQSWADDAASNHGLALVPMGSGGFKRLTVSAIQLPVVYAVDGDTTRVLLRLLDRTSIVELDPQIEASGTGTETLARVAGPYDYRGVVRFDLDQLPTGASLHQLILHLRFDPTAAHAGGAAHDILLGFHQLASIPGEVLDARPPVSFLVVPGAQATVSDTTTAVAIDVSALGRGVDDGILIKAPGDFPSLVELGFVTREGNVADRPRLEVIYTLPASGRL